jgi:tRNA A-37 threonylcarbamoyl transferase component Bud32
MELDKGIYSGGVIRTPAYVDGRHAFEFFMQNSTFSILTNNSISCITFRATLNPGVESPYKSIRYGNFNEPIDTLLLKLMPVGSDTRDDWLKVPGRGSYNGIEIGTPDTMREEIQIQQDIFTKSYGYLYKDEHVTDATRSNYENKGQLDPICPAIIYTQRSFNCMDPELFNMTTKLVPRRNKTLAQEQSEISRTLNLGRQDRRVYIESIALIVMEFMNGCVTLDDFLNDPTYSDAHKDYMSDVAAFELDQMHRIGYIHGDNHEGNIMIEPNYLYTRTMNPDHRGKLLIIDFGRSTQTNPNIPMTNRELMKCDRHDYRYTTTTFQEIYNDRRNMCTRIERTISTTFGQIDDILKAIRMQHRKNMFMLGQYEPDDDTSRLIYTYIDLGNQILAAEYKHKQYIAANNGKRSVPLMRERDRVFTALQELEEQLHNDGMLVSVRRVALGHSPDIRSVAPPARTPPPRRRRQQTHPAPAVNTFQAHPRMGISVFLQGIYDSIRSGLDHIIRVGHGADIGDMDIADVLHGGGAVTNMMHRFTRVAHVAVKPVLKSHTVRHNTDFEKPIRLYISQTKELMDNMYDQYKPTAPREKSPSIHGKRKSFSFSKSKSRSISKSRSNSGKKSRKSHSPK